jgi:hypothetical protein
LTPRKRRWYNSLRDRIHKVLLWQAGGPPRDFEGRPVELEVGETLELLFVFIMIGISMAILVAFGHWWQR